jgi:hypothetical protein
VYAAGYAPNKPDDYPGFIGMYSATTRTWSSLPGQPALDNCSVHGVSGDATTILFVGECAGMAQLWSYARGTMTWTTNAFPVILGPLFSVQKLGGEIYAIGDFGAAWTRGGAWQTDATITGRSISGTSASDVWVAGVFTQIQHWDGTAWSKMTTRLLGPAVVHATANRVLFPGAAANHVSLLREP